MLKILIRATNMSRGTQIRRTSEDVLAARRGL